MDYEKLHRHFGAPLRPRNPSGPAQRTPSLHRFPDQFDRFFMSDENWRDYTYFGQCDMDRLRAVENPTLEDMVRIFADRPFRDGKHTIISREHSYGRCVLFLRAAWLKMHFPQRFQATVIIRTSK